MKNEKPQELKISLITPMIKPLLKKILIDFIVSAIKTLAGAISSKQDKNNNEKDKSQDSL